MNILVQFHYVSQVLLKLLNASFVLSDGFLLSLGVSLQLADSLRIALVSTLKLFSLMLGLWLLNFSFVGGLILLESTESLLQLPILSLEGLGPWVFVH